MKGKIISLLIKSPIMRSFDSDLICDFTKFKSKLKVFLMITGLLPFLLLGQPTNVQMIKSDYRLSSGSSEGIYLPARVIIKVKPQYRQYCELSEIKLEKLEEVFTYLKAENPKKKFPSAEPPMASYNERGEKLADLSLIFEFHYLAKISVEQAIVALMNTGLIEYAEPHYIPKPLFVPNDPASIDTVNPMKRYYLELIRAFQAWDLERGDTAVVIGIVDSGTDTDHPDLQANIRYNYNDPIDQLDNDNDGYTDNFIGWDLGMMDNDPQSVAILHGVHMSGTAAASTGNGIGMSGTGFNCRFLPVKVDNELGQFTMAYEGIVYAADHACQIINCSWGDIYSNGQYGQDIIDYATINKDALLIAACGNENNEIPFFPASYKHVLSVAATNKYDIKSTLSSYGIHIDISAPGDSIYSTWNGGGYVFSHGTSSASSIISGCAAIVRSFFPGYSALQTAERLRITSDRIDTLASNSQYHGLLGSGRVNLYRAISDPPKPSVRLDNCQFIDLNGGAVIAGDTLELLVGFRNYLDSAFNLSIEMHADATYFQLINPVINIGNVPAVSSFDNMSQPFRMLVLNPIPANEMLLFNLNYIASNYEDFEYFEEIFNDNLIDVTTPRITATVTSKGKLGYDDVLNSRGHGFIYNNNGQSVLFNGGLLIGVSNFRISDNTYDDIGGFNDEFTAVENAIELTIPYFADTYISGIFNDEQAGGGKLDVEVIHHEYAWNAESENKFIIYEYTIVNKGLAILSDMYVGMFVDWDIANKTRNSAAFDANHLMGYAFTNEGSGLYAGVSLLSAGSAFYYAFDFNGEGGSIALNDGFTDNEKYEVLKGNELRLMAGVNFPGNDVANMLSTGPFSLSPGDSIKVAFAMIAGDHLADLQAGAGAAAFKYSAINSISTESTAVIDGIKLSEANPNPCTSNADFSLYLPRKIYVELVLSDISGRTIKHLGNNWYDEGNHPIKLETADLNPGMYFFTLNTAHSQITRKLIVAKN